MKQSKTMHAIRHKYTGKFWISIMAGHVWTESPCITQLDSEKLKAERSCCNIQLNLPQYYDKIYVSEVCVSWDA